MYLISGSDACITMVAHALQSLCMRPSSAPCLFKSRMGGWVGTLGMRPGIGREMWFIVHAFSAPLHSYPRDEIITGDPYAGFDRHNGEIAGFHLDG